MGKFKWFDPTIWLGVLLCIAVTPIAVSGIKTVDPTVEDNALTVRAAIINNTNLHDVVVTYTDEKMVLNTEINFTEHDVPTVSLMEDATAAVCDTIDGGTTKVEFYLKQYAAPLPSSTVHELLSFVPGLQYPADTATVAIPVENLCS